MSIAVGLLGPVGIGPTLLCALLGITVCTCTVTVSTASGLGVERSEYAPVPFFFTDVPIYAERGANAFIRLGWILSLVILSSVPAFVGTAPAVYERFGAFGVPVGAVRVGSLLLAVGLTAIVTRTAFGTAVRRFRDYHIE